jgi:hypothetical protein
VQWPVKSGHHLVAVGPHENLLGQTLRHGFRVLAGRQVVGDLLACVRVAPATENLQRAIESATKLKVDLVDTSRAQMNSTETFMVVGNKPF